MSQWFTNVRAMISPWFFCACPSFLMFARAKKPPLMTRAITEIHVNKISHISFRFGRNIERHIVHSDNGRRIYLWSINGIFWVTNFEPSFDCVVASVDALISIECIINSPCFLCSHCCKMMNVSLQLLFFCNYPSIFAVFRILVKLTNHYLNLIFLALNWCGWQFITKYAIIIVR